MRKLSYNLSTGSLNLTLHKEVLPFEDLLEVRERINPKRAFIFASKVLGRYHPTKISTIKKTARSLASLVPTDCLKGNVTSISVADSGLILGCALNQELKKRVGKRFTGMYTSHVALKQQTVAHFVEPHSHTPNKFLQIKESELKDHSYFKTDTLILIDDEVTSGTTLKNLFTSLKLTHVKRVIVLTIADWSTDLLQFNGIETQVFSLLSGTHSWSTNNVTPKSFPKNLLNNIQQYYTKPRSNFIQLSSNVFIMKPGSELKVWDKVNNLGNVLIVSASFSPVIFQDTMQLEDGTYLYNTSKIFKSLRVKSYVKSERFVH